MSAIETLIQYLHQQFPATIGCSPLETKIFDVWKEGHSAGMDMYEEELVKALGLRQPGETAQTSKSPPSPSPSRPGESDAGPSSSSTPGQS